MIGKAQIAALIIVAVILGGAAEWVDAPAWLAFVAGVAYVVVSLVTFGEWDVIEIGFNEDEQ